MLGLVRNIFACLDETTVPRLYMSIVRLDLGYGNIIWSPYTKMDAAEVDKVQRRAIKSAPVLKDLSYIQRLMQLLSLPSNTDESQDTLFSFPILITASAMRPGIIRTCFYNLLFLTKAWSVLKPDSTCFGFKNDTDWRNHFTNIYKSFNLSINSLCIRHPDIDATNMIRK